MSTRVFISVLLCFSALFTAAQTAVYHPFPTDTARWGMLYYVASYGGGLIPSYYSFHYNDELRGDTVINNTTYLKVYSNNHLIGALREDSSRRVWFYGFPNASNVNTYATSYYRTPFPGYQPSVEALLYDFSLEVGDSVQQYAHLGTGYTIENTTIVSKVIGIDSILLIDSTYRRMLVVEATTLNNNLGLSKRLYWVEGIGALGFDNRQCLESNYSLYDASLEDNGLFGSVYIKYASLSAQAISSLVTCFLDRDTTYLGFNRTALCSSPMPVETLQDATISVVLVPNPWHSQTTLIITAPKTYDQYTVSVYTTTGQLVVQTQASESKVRLSRQGLASGLYFYQVVGDATLLYTGKLVVN